MTQSQNARGAHSHNNTTIGKRIQYTANWASSFMSNLWKWVVCSHCGHLYDVTAMGRRDLFFCCGLLVLLHSQTSTVVYAFINSGLEKWYKIFVFVVDALVSDALIPVVQHVRVIKRLRQILPYQILAISGLAALYLLLWDDLCIFC